MAAEVPAEERLKEAFSRVLSAQAGLSAAQSQCELAMARVTEARLKVDAAQLAVDDILAQARAEAPPNTSWSRGRIPE